MPQYSVPQFIEEEGRIVSFLTFRQFFWIVGGGAVCFFFFTIFPLWLFLTLSIPTVIVVVTVAFVKVDNESIVNVLLHFLGFSFGQKKYVWQKKEFTYSPGTPTNNGYKVAQLKKHMETKK